MTSPEFSTHENAGYGADTQNTGNEGVGGNAANSAANTTANTAAQRDDVSFAKTLGVDQASDKIKDVAQRGVANAQDAMSQLQAKASELTSNLIDRVNVDELTQKLEEQVRDHPTRTLLMAAGAGFLLGRVAKK